MKHRIIRVTSEKETYFIIQYSYFIFRLLGIWFTHNYEDSESPVKYKTLSKAKERVCGWENEKEVIISKEKVYETNNSNSRN